ncbi:hypothetical protein HMPREF0972_01857 [Actinomyces sp. oral taxon 848 str. F0332]|nr:hypothetical protein HMPREF0972_01857 [Actinomyces sp. oral taxon 848 str. F0332]
MRTFRGQLGEPTGLEAQKQGKINDSRGGVRKLRLGKGWQSSSVS